MRVFAWIGLAVFFTGLAFFVARLTAPHPTVWRHPAERGSEFTIIYPRLREINLLGVRFEATAKQATFNQAVSEATGKDLMGFWLQEGHRTQMSAGRGRYDLNRQEAFLTDGIRIKNRDGYALTTTTATYEHATQTMHATGHFEAEGKNVSLQGTGLTYSFNADTFSVERDVGAIVKGFRF